MAAHLLSLWHLVWRGTVWLFRAAILLCALYSLFSVSRDGQTGKFRVWGYTFIAGVAFLGLALVGIKLNSTPLVLACLGLFAMSWLATIVLVIVPDRLPPPEVDLFPQSQEGVWPPPPKDDETSQ